MAVFARCIPCIHGLRKCNFIAAVAQRATSGTVIAFTAICDIDQDVFFSVIKVCVTINSWATVSSVFRCLRWWLLCGWRFSFGSYPFPLQIVRPYRKISFPFAARYAIMKGHTGPILACGVCCTCRPGVGSAGGIFLQYFSGHPQKKIDFEDVTCYSYLQSSKW